MPREKSAGAIIFYMESSVPLYLLLHYPSLNRKGGHWEFAKGHVEPGESDIDTLRREVVEETGLTNIKILSGFKEHIKYFFKQYPDKMTEAEKASGKTKWIFKLVTFFAAESKTKDIKLSPEHIGFLWLPFDEAFKKTTFKKSKLLLSRANEFVMSQKSK